MEKFPYGNPLDDPGSWAGNPVTKSQDWLVGYHSGWASILGAHTLLFFGAESLCAFVATLSGAGVQLQYGLSDAQNKLSRAGSVDKSPFGVGSSAPLKRIEKGKDAQDIVDWADSFGEIKSAKGIYNTLTNLGQTSKSLRPFSANELGGAFGVISGVAADVLIGGAKAYFADASNLFTEFVVKNISFEKTLVSASIGSLGGFWSVDKVFNLWHEVTNESREEYPFQGYAYVHEYFRHWRNTEYARLVNNDKFDQQVKVINEITDDMEKNPSKFGFGNDSLAALREGNARFEKFYDGNMRELSVNPFRAWIPSDKKYLFK
ncbi:hypothetical protein [Rhizobium skierniewicense]|uniref:hypothetical protein n=1 Tax=Rhizobium skierniewicense TaxID=984260 RepID=UPI001571988B|nr:hypothetical protein [Rhizobium skierniewicense]NTF33963.1 hypothetical protein [Rhizobium skierniewicense]